MRHREQGSQAESDCEAWNETQARQVPLQQLEREQSMPEFEPGQMVILRILPTGLIDGLPKEDQTAILAIIGLPVTLAGYSFDQAELEFVDEFGDGHSIWVEPSLIRAA